MAEQKKPKLLVLGAATSPHVVARARVFAKLGWDVTMLSPLPPSEPFKDITVLCTARGTGLFGKIHSLLACASTLLKSQADVFHAHYAAEYGTWLAALLRRHPLVITVMGGDVLFTEQGSLGTIGRWLTTFALRKADYVTAKSKRLAITLEQLGVKPSRIEVVYWGVEPDLFYPDKDAGALRREKWGVASNKQILFCPRMLQPLYNQNLLVAALPKILDVFPDTHLVLSGYGKNEEYSELIEDQVRNLGLEKHLTVVEGLQRPEMASAYNTADMVISIPSSDGMPQSVLEAMACEKPLIISDLEHYRELFSDGETAALVKLDPDSIAKRVIGLLRNPDSASQMASSAAKLVAKVASFPQQANLVATKFKQLMGDPH